MKTPLLFALASAATLSTLTSFADDKAAIKAACLDASSKAQTLRSAHQLLEAREQLRICSAARCPTVVRDDCARWTDAVESALPSVVITAKTGAGLDTVDVRVTVDGQPFAEKLDGRALPINPGAHAFHFVATDGTVVDRSVVVAEGESNHQIAVVIGPVPPPAAVVAPAPTAAAREPEGPGPSKGPWRTVGWVLGGAGIVGLGVGFGLGAVAMGDKNSAHCNGAGQCLPGPLGDARSAATGADVAVAVGAAFVAAGLALVIFAPAASPEREGQAPATEHLAARVGLAPSAGAHGGSLVIDGAW
jgi:hypothetical protein